MNELDLLRHAENISRRLLSLSQQGWEAARDDSCRVIYSSMQDNAYRIRKMLKRYPQTSTRRSNESSEK